MALVVGYNTHVDIIIIKPLSHKAPIQPHEPIMKRYRRLPTIRVPA